MMFIELFKSFEVSEIWEETKEDNPENNRRILGYLYKTLESTTNQFLNSTVFSEEIKFTQVISGLLNELVKENILTVIRVGHKNYFHAPQIKEPIPFNDESVFFNRKINVWRGSSKEQLDHNSIKMGIKEIIESLENYRFRVSDILKILIDNSNYGIPLNKDENGEEEKIYVDHDKKTDDIESDDQIIAERTLNKFQRLYPSTKYGERVFVEDLKILYWKFMCSDLTQSQIALRVFGNKDRFRSVSTRLKVIEEKLVVLNRNGKLNQDEKEMKAFFELIRKRFIIKRKRENGKG